MSAAERPTGSAVGARTPGTGATPARRRTRVKESYYVQWLNHDIPLPEGCEEIAQRTDDHHSTFGRLVKVNR